jgi:predicted transcriptional regulator
LNNINDPQADAGRQDQKPITWKTKAGHLNSVKKVYKCLKKGQTARVLNMIHRNREEEDEDAGAKMLQKKRECYKDMTRQENKGTVTR